MLLTRPHDPSAEPVTAASDGSTDGGVREIQRIRLIDAATEVACERGAANVTVADVVTRSGMSRRTFYEQFDDRDGCLLAAFEEGFRRAAARIAPAYRSRGRWRERMRASLLALLGFLEEEPTLGRLLIVETLAAGPVVLKRRSRVLAHLVQAVREGEDESRSDLSVPPLVAEGVIGAVLAVIHARMLAGEEQPWAELANPLMAMIVLPYLGPPAARRELARPQSQLEPASRVVSINPLVGLEMRLTYRTARVLSAIGSHPECSNRRVAQMADISDAGQASKLLARLEHLGLIERNGSEQIRNSWRLTPRGEAIERFIATRPSPH